MWARRRAYSLILARISLIADVGKSSANICDTIETFCDLRFRNAQKRGIPCKSPQNRQIPCRDRFAADCVAHHSLPISRANSERLTQPPPIGAFPRALPGSRSAPAVQRPPPGGHIQKKCAPVSGALFSDCTRFWGSGGEQRLLLTPERGEPIIHQPRCSQRQRLTSLDDRCDHLGRQPGQPDQPRESVAALPVRRRDILDRHIGMREQQRLHPTRLGKQGHQRRISLRFISACNHQPGCLAVLSFTAGATISIERWPSSSIPSRRPNAGPSIPISISVS